MLPEIDPYRSRAIDRAEIAPRVDPVIWGDADGDGPLTREQLDEYAERGVLICREMIGPAELAGLREAADRLREAANPDRDDVIVEPDSWAIRSLFRVHRDGATFARLAADRRFAGAARQILGSDVHIQQSRINFKPGFDGAPFPWHSDFETWHIEDGMPRPRALSVSILLTDNGEHNGPLLVVPGSHELYVRCVGETPDDHYKESLVNQAYGVPDRASLVEVIDGRGIASATGPAGTVVYFDCNTMHASAGNITPDPRNNVFFVFNSVDNALVAPFGGIAPRPDFLAERAVIPL